MVHCLTISFHPGDDVGIALKIFIHDGKSMWHWLQDFWYRVHSGRMKMYECHSFFQSRYLSKVHILLSIVDLSKWPWAHSKWKRLASIKTLVLIANFIFYRTIFSLPYHLSHSNHFLYWFYHEVSRIHFTFIGHAFPFCVRFCSFPFPLTSFSPSFSLDTISLHSSVLKTWKMRSLSFMKK